MAILKVARLGNPVLRKVCSKVDEKEITTVDFQRFVDDMIETMREYAGIGLAAPQVHRPIRVSVIDIPEDSRHFPEELAGVRVFINPEISVVGSGKSTYWEGCLSVPGMRGLVERPSKVKVKYLDRNGKPQELMADNFFSTVLQHEFDHLDGKLYVDRLVDMTKFVFEEEFDRFWLADAGEDEDLV